MNLAVVNLSKISANVRQDKALGGAIGEFVKCAKPSSYMVYYVICIHKHSDHVIQCLLLPCRNHLL